MVDMEDRAFNLMRANGGAGTTYMNLADIGLPLGITSGVYVITNSGSGHFNNSLSIGVNTNRLV